MPVPMDRKGTGLDALATTPLEAVRLLRREPLLLTAVAGSVVLALILILGPEDGRLPVAVVAGLLLAFGVLWALLRRGERRASAHSAPSNRLRWGRRATLTDSDVAAKGDNEVSMGAGATVTGVRFTAGGLPEPREAVAAELTTTSGVPGKPRRHAKRARG